MDIEGKIIQVLPMQSGIGKSGEWKKQEFIIETKDQYPKKVCITAMNKNAELVFNVGSEVKCFVNLESREFNSKWYTTISLWKLENL
jgi:hypothetical protein